MAVREQKENWRPVPVPGLQSFYQVSDLGNVRSLHAYGSGKRGSLLSPGTITGGYQAVALGHKASGLPHTNYSVHRLVCEAFNGPPPFPDAKARHTNDIPDDNRASNLKWGTQKENIADIIRNSGHWKGERASNAVLSDNDAKRILKGLMRGKLCSEAAIRFGVHLSTVKVLAKGKTFTHIDREALMREVGISDWSYLCDVSRKKQKRDAEIVAACKTMTCKEVSQMFKVSIDKVRTLKRSA